LANLRGKPVDQIEVTPEELSLEKHIWERDGLSFSPETLEKLAKDRKEYDLWVGNGQRVAEVGD
jgi:hypothetical protein